MSKTWRLIKSAEPVFPEMGFAVDSLDLSRLAFDLNGALPLALQVLPELRARSDRRLDE
jgi:hypothetical protein